MTNWIKKPAKRWKEASNIETDVKNSIFSFNIFKRIKFWNYFSLFIHGNEQFVFWFSLQDDPIVTTATGAPIGVRDATQTVGPRGPVLLQDVNFLDELSHFDRERIPERVVHAKGAGAFGYFEVTHPEIKKYSAAKVFSDVGKKTPIAVRFSTVGGESGSAGNLLVFSHTKNLTLLLSMFWR